MWKTSSQVADDIVIRAEGLGRRYLIGHQAEAERYTTFRDVIARGARSLVRSGSAVLRGHPIVSGDRTEEFWALKDVSFEVKRGEVVGIIGRNGAGKSTLLKILSRITEPSAGRVTIKGRVASLLEVGTGFHPELTGRENIYLNGAILGMTRAEIRKKFDEIVAFAEVERFLDTPVKHYSSGMYVRLAFAVAAHLESEILIVDEVLAVGDIEFQKKCLGKMQNVVDHGRTVLFVSHAMASISSLSSRCMLLDEAKIAADCEPANAIQLYLGNSRNKVLPEYVAHSKKTPSILSVKTSLSETNNVHTSGSELTISVTANFPEPTKNPCLSLQIVNEKLVPVVHFWSYDSEVLPSVTGRHNFTFIVPRLALNIGRYSLTLYLSEPPGGKIFEIVEEVCAFDVVILGRTTLFGWNMDACTYLEDFRCIKS
jgi:ABC-type polysaccharide/polyol phosphate transport system ATPase subunit